MLMAGVADAKTLGWFLKMCISDSATFFSCTVAGITLFTYIASCQCVIRQIQPVCFCILDAVTASTIGKCSQQTCKSQRSSCFLRQSTHCKIFTTKVSFSRYGCEGKKVGDRKSLIQHLFKHLKQTFLRFTCKCSIPSIS